MVNASDVEDALRSKLQAEDVEVIDISGGYGCKTSHSHFLLLFTISNLILPPPPTALPFFLQLR
jgi:hypothetical protein